MFFQSNVERKVDQFPEFIEVDGEIYQLDTGGEDEDELIQRGEELVEKNGMPVTEFEIRQKEEVYGLYIK